MLMSLSIAAKDYIILHRLTKCHEYCQSTSSLFPFGGFISSSHSKGFHASHLVILVYFVHEGVGGHDFSLVVVQQGAGLCHADVGLLQIPRCSLKERAQQTVARSNAK